MQIKSVPAKTILVKSNLPDCDYVINPYIGCGFSCKYCYASFMCRFVDRPQSDWGKFVYIKNNADQLLAKEIKKLANHGEGKSIFLSSVTDPYQGLEAKYQLTRKCLQVLLDHDFQGEVSILTKSDLVLRDIDLFSKLRNIEVGLTITSADDGISRYFEKYAPLVSNRINALKKLNLAGIKTYAFIGPLLPHFVTSQTNLDKLFKSIAETGTKDVYVEHLNLSAYIKNRLLEELGEQRDLINKFYQVKSSKFRQQIDSIIKELVNKYHFNLRLGETIHH